MLSTLYAKPVPVSEAERAANRANQPAVRVFTEVLHRDPPGPWTDNRLEQSQHFTGVIYTAICAKAVGLKDATLRVMKRNQSPVFQSKKARRIEREYRRLVRKSGAPGDEFRGDDLTEADPSDSWSQVFEFINQTDTFADLMEDWTIQQNLTGITWLWCRPSKLGWFAPPCEFYIIPTGLTSTYLPSTEPIGAYPYGAVRVMPYYPSGAYGVLPYALAAQGAILDGRELKKHRRRHPLYRWDGYSPLTAGGIQFDVLEAIDQSRKAAMDHGFRPDVVATIKGATAETLDRFQADLEMKHGGSRNSHRIFATNGEGVDIEPMTTAPKEMDYSSGWDQMVKFALALIGVPPAVAGIVESTSYSQLFASLKQFHTLTLGPTCRDIARFLTKNVVRPYDADTVIQIDVPQLDDRELMRAETEMLCKYGLVKENEVRGKYNYEPLPDGDQLVGERKQNQEMQAAMMPGPGGVGGGDEGGEGVGAGVQPGGDANEALDHILGLSGAGGAPKGPSNPSAAGSLPKRQKSWVLV